HPDASGAPRLRRQPSDRVAAILRLLGGVFIDAHARGVARAACVEVHERVTTLSKVTRGRAHATIPGRPVGIIPDERRDALVGVRSCDRGPELHTGARGDPDGRIDFNLVAGPWLATLWHFHYAPFLHSQASVWEGRARLLPNRWTTHPAYGASSAGA